jgi:uncharacterized protein
MTGYASILKSIDGQYYFVLKAGNYKVVATSEMYRTRQAALKTLTNLFPNFFIYENK